MPAARTIHESMQDEQDKKPATELGSHDCNRIPSDGKLSTMIQMQPTLGMSSSSAMTSDRCPCCFTRMCSTRAVSFMVASVGGMATASMLTAGLVAFGLSSRVILQVMVTQLGELCPANLKQDVTRQQVAFGAGGAGTLNITWAASHRAPSEHLMSITGDQAALPRSTTRFTSYICTILTPVIQKTI